MLHIPTNLTTRLSLLPSLEKSSRVLVVINSFYECIRWNIKEPFLPKSFLTSTHVTNLEKLVRSHKVQILSFVFPTSSSRDGQSRDWPSPRSPTPFFLVWNPGSLYNIKSSATNSGQYKGDGEDIEPRSVELVVCPSKGEVSRTTLKSRPSLFTSGFSCCVKSYRNL